MCANRLNWLADLPSSQGRAGKMKRTPVLGIASPFECRISPSGKPPTHVLHGTIQPWYLSSEVRSPGSIAEGPGAVFQILLILANGGHFGLFRRVRVLPGIGNCAEFAENGCKFVLISPECTRILENNAGEPNVRK